KMPLWISRSASWSPTTASNGKGLEVESARLFAKALPAAAFAFVLGTSRTSLPQEMQRHPKGSRAAAYPSKAQPMTHWRGCQRFHARRNRRAQTPKGYWDGSGPRGRHAAERRSQSCRDKCLAAQE